MYECFELIYNFYSGIWDLLNRILLPVEGVDVSLGGLLFACVAISLILAVFWKGAKA